MKTAQAIFGALAAAVGLAAVVTFYDEFMPGTQMPPHPNEAAQKGDLLTAASSIAHDFAVLPKSVHATPTSSISQDSAVLPKSVRTVPADRRHSPRWGRRHNSRPPSSQSQDLQPPASFSSVATTLSSRAEPLDVCAKYGGHRVHFMRGHHAMWKCVYRKRRQ
jgi:hypothetical protein